MCLSFKDSVLQDGHRQYGNVINEETVLTSLEYCLFFFPLTSLNLTEVVELRSSFCRSHPVMSSSHYGTQSRIKLCLRFHSNPLSYNDIYR